MKRADFSRVAPAYRYLEHLVFGEALHKRRRAFLDELRGATNVLILGDGDGRFTVDFLRAKRKVKVLFVDSSAEMIHLAQSQVESLRLEEATVEFQRSDARTVVLKGPYELVISHFFLDCFSTAELSILIPRIAAAAAPNAQWLVSEFGLIDGGIGRMFSWLLIRIMYLFFRWTASLTVKELPNYGSVLKSCGFQRRRVQSAMGGLLVSELWTRCPEGQLQDASSNAGVHQAAYELPNSGEKSRNDELLGTGIQQVPSSHLYGSH